MSLSRAAFGRQVTLQIKRFNLIWVVNLMLGPCVYENDY